MKTHGRGAPPALPGKTKPASDINLELQHRTVTLEKAGKKSRCGGGGRKEARGCRRRGGGWRSRREGRKEGRKEGGREGGREGRKEGRKERNHLVTITN